MISTENVVGIYAARNNNIVIFVLCALAPEHCKVTRQTRAPNTYALTHIYTHAHTHIHNIHTYLDN